MVQSIAEKVTDLARPIVDAQQAFIIDIIVRGERGGKVVEIFVDTDHGVTTDLCAEISRELSRAFDVADIFQGRYHLVVSSPGIDRPLKLSRQYPQHTGRTLRVKYMANEEAQIIEGKLIEITPDGIALQLKDDAVVQLLYGHIVEARVKTAW